MVGPIMYIAAGLIALWAYTQRKAYGNLTFFPGNITGAAFEGATPVVYCTLLVQNTSNITVMLNSFSANAFANGILVGNASIFEPVAIMENSQSTVLLTIRLQMIGIVSDILRAIQLGNFKQSLQLIGSANVDGVQIEVDLKLST